MYRQRKNIKVRKGLLITYCILKTLFIIAMVLGAAWFIFSLVEVWLHGWVSTWEYDYSSFNLFIVLLSW